jgi:hypothetical protein
MKYLFLEIVVVPLANGEYKATEADDSDSGLPSLDPESDTVLWGRGKTPQAAVIHLMELLDGENWFEESEGG